MISTILVATDGSEAAANAERFGTALASRMKGRLLCVTVVEDRFTLVSLDAFTGDYVEVKLWGAGGGELAAGGWTGGLAEVDRTFLLDPVAGRVVGVDHRYLQPGDFHRAALVEAHQSLLAHTLRRKPRHQVEHADDLGISQSRDVQRVGQVIEVPVRDKDRVQPFGAHPLLPLARPHLPPGDRVRLADPPIAIREHRQAVQRRFGSNLGPRHTNNPPGLKKLPFLTAGGEEPPAMSPQRPHPVATAPGTVPIAGRTVQGAVATWLCDRNSAGKLCK